MDQPFDRDADHAYREYARKWDLILDGPTTTNFQQLLDKGIELPEPDNVPDARMRSKVWEVLAALASVGHYLDHTDHLSDRELYTKLWRDVMREEVPALDEFRCNQVMMLQADGVEPDTSTFFRYYAEDWWREDHQKEYPDYAMPPHEEPPYNRDCLLPIAPGHGLAEASNWLAANWSKNALASNRFDSSEDALALVEQLYAAGATAVLVDHVTMLPDQDFAPYASRMVVELPEDASQRGALLGFINDTARPTSVEDVKKPYMAKGPDWIRLGWD